MILIPATESDLSEVVAFLNSMYGRHALRGGWTSEADLVAAPLVDVETVRTALAQKPGAALLVLRNDLGELLACVSLEPATDDIWHVGMLTVRPDFQDRKIGRRLLEAAETVARENGARLMRMKVINVRDSLISWYQRRGYILSGESFPVPYGDPPRPDLSFIMLEKAL
jgi:ribosomal protein S18 acetylase RimI-like enzyme